MKRWTNETRTISDDNGIELLVTFDAEQSDSDEHDFHGSHEVGLMFLIEILSVELVIAGEGVVLNNLSKKQEKKLRSLVQDSLEND